MTDYIFNGRVKIPIKVYPEASQNPNTDWVIRIGGSYHVVSRETAVQIARSILALEESFESD